MARGKPSKPVYLVAVLAMAIAFSSRNPARAMDPQGLGGRLAQTESPSVPSGGIPAEAQLVNASTFPTIRIPVSHSTLNWTLIKPRIRASFGWLEIDRDTVRYNLVRQSRVTKEADQGFDLSRTALLDLKMEYGAAEFRADGLRHFFTYSPQSHWDAVDASTASARNISQADGVYTPYVVRALQSFDGAVADLKLQQQSTIPPPLVVQPEPPPVPKPVAAPTPPVLVLMAPGGASASQTIEVNEPTLTVRGVAMDDAGLPTITINGTGAALRPKNDKAAEFWSDPISLKPGANPIDIVATSPAKATAHFQFVAQYTPKAVPVNPRALGKEEIISLLKGGVPDPHVSELVKDRGIKFTPTPSDLDEIRAAGGGDDLVQAIKQSAAGK
jgi:hypothetical protein